MLVEQLQINWQTQTTDRPAGSDFLPSLLLFLWSSTLRNAEFELNTCAAIWKNHRADQQVWANSRFSTRLDRLIHTFTAIRKCCFQERVTWLEAVINMGLDIIKTFMLKSLDIHTENVSRQCYNNNWVEIEMSIISHLHLIYLSIMYLYS